MEFCDGVIKIVIPAGAAAAWAGDETQVGIYETLARQRARSVLSIEKDFECLEPRGGENQSNRFKNPKKRHRNEFTERLFAAGSN